MTRVKNGITAHKTREKILKYTKGFRWGRKKKERAAKEALLHAWTHAFRGRKERKRDFRALWNIRINAATRTLGTKYSSLISGLQNKNVKLNRKMLSELAADTPKAFEAIVNLSK